MRGSISSQLGRLSVEVNKLGESKYEAKADARIELASAGLSATSEAIAEKTGIYSAGTMSNYMERWIEFGEYAKSELGIKDMEKLDADAVRSFLADKIEQDVSYSHFSQYCAALGKLEQAIESFGQSVRGIERDPDFKSAIDELRPEARAELSRFEGTRAYDNPGQLVENLSGTSQLVASIQLESGTRLSEASNITAGQLKGMSQDCTDKVVGQFDFVGKGGKENVGNLSPETYERLVQHIAEHGSLSHSVDVYREDLKQASERTGQEYNASHGLRWNFAQDRYNELRSAGFGEKASLGQVSEEMGHNRIEITNHYLGH